MLFSAFYKNIKGVSDGKRDAFAAYIASSYFLFHFSNNLIYWLYSFKQWSISVQVPALMNKPQEIWLTPTRYRQIKWAGIAVNAAVIIALSISEYFVNRQRFDPTSTTATLCFTFSILASVLLLVSVIFMIDTVRRFK